MKSGGRLINAVVCSFVNLWLSELKNLPDLSGLRTGLSPQSSEKKGEKNFSGESGCFRRRRVNASHRARDNHRKTRLLGEDEVSNKLATIDFHGDDILAFFDEKTGKIYANVKRMCEAIGVNFASQIRKIQKDPVYASALRYSHMTTPSGTQESLFLKGR